MKIDTKSVHSMLMFQRVHVDQIIPLRHKILRAGMPIETARFPTDDISGASHFAMFFVNASRVHVSGPICCVSLAPQPFNSESAWQLRGMATEYAYQGMGFGGALLAWAEEAILLQSSIRMLWCNARMSAMPFYKGAGWKVVSDVFKIRTAGPHCKMTKMI